MIQSGPGVMACQEQMETKSVQKRRSNSSAATTRREWIGPIVQELLPSGGKETGPVVRLCCRQAGRKLDQ